jgi:hypothetical protein
LEHYAFSSVEVAQIIGFGTLYGIFAQLLAFSSRLKQRILHGILLILLLVEGSVNQLLTQILLYIAYKNYH